MGQAPFLSPERIEVGPHRELFLPVFAEIIPGFDDPVNDHSFFQSIDD